MQHAVFKMNLQYNSFLFACNMFGDLENDTTRNTLFLK